MIPKQLEIDQSDLNALRHECLTWWLNHNIEGKLPNGKKPNEAEFVALAWLQASINILYRKGVVENLTIGLDTTHYEPVEEGPASNVEEPTT